MPLLRPLTLLPLLPTPLLAPPRTPPLLRLPTLLLLLPMPLLRPLTRLLLRRKPRSSNR